MTDCQSFTCSCPTTRTTTTATNLQRHYDSRIRSHRLDGPARETPDTRTWHHHGVRHRLDGPAKEILDGEALWRHRGRICPLEDVIDAWLTANRPGHTPGERDLLVTLARDWPYGSNLAALHAAAAAATA